MRTFLTAATGLPTILLTAALVVVVCFWLLVTVGAAAPDSFDTDVDLRGWRMGGVPAAVALSLLTFLAWGLSVGATLALPVVTPPGPATWLLRLALPVGALFVSWPATCLIVRLLRPLFPDEPEPPVLEKSRTGEGPELRDAERQDPGRRTSGHAELPSRDRAA